MRGPLQELGALNFKLGRGCQSRLLLLVGRCKAGAPQPLTSQFMSPADWDQPMLTSLPYLTIVLAAAVATPKSKGSGTRRRLLSHIVRPSQALPFTVRLAGFTARPVSH